MSVEFTINGKLYKVSPPSVPIDTSLNTFIRQHAQLKGTKFMCLEGGCGACIVTLKGLHPVTKEKSTWAVNSCLYPVYACRDLDILTIEGIGNKKDGYHPVQERLAHFNGTQCGYCSPGMVMNMYSLLEAKGGKISMAEIENSFGGNICRCTGYRPILDAFKSLATDADEKYLDLCKDIEDLGKICPTTGNKCSKGTCQKKSSAEESKFIVDEDQKMWCKPKNVNEIFECFSKTKNSPYMIIAGNTAHGVYRRDMNIKYFIEVCQISELRGHSIGNEIVIGGNVNLTETMDILSKAAKKDKKFEYCNHLVHHIDLIANVPVRNAGTIAGNLSIKNQHKEFPSDMFIMLEACGAKIKIADSSTKSADYSIEEFVKLNMNQKLILSISLPALDPSVFVYRSFKIMPRAQNAHAYVNSGFLAEMQAGMIKSIRICFGGINPEFVHAKQAEQYLVGKNLYTDETLQEVMKILNNELQPDWVLPDASEEYRKSLAMALFYKFVINTCPDDKVKPEYKSGGEILQRPVSSGTQTFDTYEANWPLTQPVRKLEALIQAGGEAEYANDMPNLPNELWAAFVPATKVHSVIAKIDASEALAIPGVYAFYSAKDIPGVNSFTSPKIMLNDDPEEIFCSGEVLYHSQPAGIILADSFITANNAVHKVKIMYEKNDNVSYFSEWASALLSPFVGQSENVKVTRQIVPTLKHAIELNATDRIERTEAFDTKPEDTEVNGFTGTKQIKGNFQMNGQYHYTMEAQTTVCVPSDIGLDVYCATQWIDAAQIAVAQAVNMKESEINMVVKRLGGAYGGKVSRPNIVACAAAIGAVLTNRPVRFVLSIEANMNTIGKRFSCYCDYDVQVDDNGKILKVKNEYTQDGGSSKNEQVMMSTSHFFGNCYERKAWEAKANLAITDSPSNTWCRAPGTTEGIAMTENIIEHVARAVGKDPVDIRLINMTDDNMIKKLMPKFLQDIEYHKRRNEINEFNKKNRWIKRGIAVSPMQYAQEYFGSLGVQVTIHHGDGSVAISHAGIECGQGINTKAAQIAAFTLGISMDLIKIKPSNNFVGSNAFPTGGSMTSEVVGFAIKKACEELLARLKPVRDEMKSAPWSDVVHAAYFKLVDLSARYMYKVTDLKTYTTWGIACAETEVDVLTGNVQLRRVDLLEDTGESLSPNVDIGQVEGAFIMGVGYWLTEGLVYHRENGELLTNRTWTYKPPGAKDIPIDFRVTFLQKSSNPFGVLRSKATGEPAFCMSVVVIFALRHALDSARADAGATEDWYHLGAPSMPDQIFLSANNSFDKFTLMK